MDSEKLVANVEASGITQENVLQKGKAKAKLEAKAKTSEARAGLKEQVKQMKKDSKGKGKEKDTKITEEAKGKDRSTGVAIPVVDHTSAGIVRREVQEMGQSNAYQACKR